MKMKNLVNCYFVFAMLQLSCSSSFLEIPPYAQVSEPILANKEGVQKLLIGAYSTLDEFASGDGYYLNNYTIPDDARAGANAGVNRDYDCFALSANAGIPNTRWSVQYLFIMRANTVLEILPQVTDITPEERLHIEAQARFIRAFHYLKAAMLWKNVPWIDETVNYGARNYLVANDTDIYSKVEEDFLFAAEHLPVVWAEVGRANKWAAKSFLVKTYLFQQKFQEAKDLLDDIVVNGRTSNNLKYALLPKYRDNFRTATKHGSEAVFTIQNSTFDGSNGQNGNVMYFQNGTYGGPASTGYGWYQPTFDLVDAFQTDEVTGLPLLDTYHQTPIPSDYGLTSSQPFTPYTGPLDPRLDWSVGRRGIPYLDWGINPGAAWVRNQITGGPYTSIKHAAEQASVETDREAINRTNVPHNIIRYADVLLWAAECEVEVGSLAKAEEYVNLVRARAANPDGFVYHYNADGSRSNIPAANYKVGLYTGQFSANGQSYARKAVRFERRLELAMEYHRYFDLMRYDGNDFDVAVHHNTFMQREGNRMKHLFPDVPYLTSSFTRGRNELWPIPTIQIDLSVGADGVSVLRQNPGYEQ